MESHVGGVEDSPPLQKKNNNNNIIKQKTKNFRRPKLESGILRRLGGDPLVQRRRPEASERAVSTDRVRPAAANRCCRAGSSLVTGGALLLRSPARAQSGAAAALGRV